MAEVELEALLRRYVDEVWNRRNADAVEGFLDPSYRRYVSATLPPLDRAEQIQRLRGFQTAFPDVRLDLEDLVAAGDRIAFRATMRGTHEAEFLGVAPTGTGITVGILDLWRVADGKVVEHWGGPDLTDLKRQLDAAAATSR